MTKEFKFLDLDADIGETRFEILCDKVIIKERGIEMVNDYLRNFVAQVDKIVFIDGDGKKTVFEKVGGEKTE